MSRDNNPVRRLTGLSRRPLRKRGEEEVEETRPVRSRSRKRAEVETPVRRDRRAADTEFNEDFLKSAVMRMDGKPEEVRTGNKFIHVSRLIDYCARREALSYQHSATGGIGRRVRVFSGMRIVWALGRAAEKHVREQFIEAVSAEGVYGKWLCNKCGDEIMEGLHRDNHRPCRTCGHTEATTYGEFPLADREVLIVGNPDLLYVRPDNSRLRVVEIKSINKNEFDELGTPKPQHILQALCYHRLAEINGLDPDNNITIFYVAKDFTITPYKSFTVEVSDSHRRRVDDLWQLANERADIIREFDAKLSVGQTHFDNLPPRLRVCSSDKATTAKNCIECVGCFSQP